MYHRTEERQDDAGSQADPHALAEGSRKQHQRQGGKKQYQLIAHALNQFLHVYTPV